MFDGEQRLGNPARECPLYHFRICPDEVEGWLARPRSWPHILSSLDWGTTGQAMGTLWVGGRSADSTLTDASDETEGFDSARRSSVNSTAFVLRDVLIGMLLKQLFSMCTTSVAPDRCAGQAPPRERSGNSCTWPRNPLEPDTYETRESPKLVDR